MNVKGIFRGFLQRQQAPSPTDILVGLICVKIRTDGKHIDEMLNRGYYEPHRWDWEEKCIYLHFNTQSYAKDSKAGWVDGLIHNGTEIALSPEQKERLIQALNETHRFAMAQKKIDRITQDELKACDAIEAILKT